MTFCGGMECSFPSIFNSIVRKMNWCRPFSYLSWAWGKFPRPRQTHCVSLLFGNSWSFRSKTSSNAQGQSDRASTLCVFFSFSKSDAIRSTELNGEVGGCSGVVPERTCLSMLTWVFKAEVLERAFRLLSSVGTAERSYLLECQ